MGSQIYMRLRAQIYLLLIAIIIIVFRLISLFTTQIDAFILSRRPPVN